MNKIRRFWNGWGMGRMRGRLACCGGLLLLPSLLQASTTINTVHRDAYGANIGWLNARGNVADGAVIGRYYCTGFVWSANCGWIGLGNTPANGWEYSNATATDWGVNHDGLGNLSGYAYGANIGWVLFEQTYGQPKVDLLTGNLSGSVWGANVGWISLSNSSAFVRTDFLDDGPDTDGDGIPDAYEYKVAGDLTTLGPAPDDWDADGSPDVSEYLADTNPFDDSSFFAITDLVRTAPTNFVTWTVQPTRHYVLEQNTVLTNTAAWVDSGYGVLLPGPGPDLTRGVAATNEPVEFYRARALLPLSP